MPPLLLPLHKRSEIPKEIVVALSPIFSSGVLQEQLSLTSVGVESILSVSHDYAQRSNCSEVVGITLPGAVPTYPSLYAGPFNTQ